MPMGAIDGSDAKILAAIEQLYAVEGRRGCDPINRLNDLIHLKLIGFLLGLTQARFGTVLTDQALHFLHQSGDFLQAAFHDVGDLIGTLGVPNRGRHGAFLRPQSFAGNESGRVIPAAIDLVTGTQSL